MLGKIFIYDTVARSEKCEHVGDEVPLAVIQVHPVSQVVAQVNLFYHDVVYVHTLFMSLFIVKIPSPPNK